MDMICTTLDAGKNVHTMCGTSQFLRTSFKKNVIQDFPIHFKFYNKQLQERWHNAIFVYYTHPVFQQWKKDNTLGKLQCDVEKKWHYPLRRNCLLLFFLPALKKSLFFFFKFLSMKCKKCLQLQKCYSLWSSLGFWCTHMHMLIVASHFLFIITMYGNQ